MNLGLLGVLLAQIDSEATRRREEGQLAKRTDELS